LERVVNRHLPCSAMGRGALAKVRWKNDRIRKKKARDKRKAQPAESAAAGGGSESTA